MAGTLAEVHDLGSAAQRASSLLGEERLATLAALHQERAETLKKIDAIKGRGVDAAVAGLLTVVDHAIWRLATILTLSLVATAASAVVAFRIAVAGGRPAAGENGRPGM